MAGAKPNARSMLANLIDSDFEDSSRLSLGAAEEIGDRATQAMVITKKARGRPQKQNKVTKSRPARRSSGRIAALDIEKGAVQVLADKSNQQALRTTGDRRKVASKGAKTDGLELGEQSKVPKTKATRGRPRTVKQPAEPKASECATNIRNSISPQPRGLSKAGPVARQMADSVEIPETQQPDMMDLVDEEYDQLEDLPPGSHLPAHAQAHLISSVVPSSVRSQRVVDVEVSEVSVRRRLGDLSKKYDSLELKYRDLRTIGIQEAERNFDQLRKQADERAETSKQLVADLRTELAAQSLLAKEGERVKKQLESSKATATSLQEKIQELMGSMADAKAEIKTLSTKLAASRSNEVVSVPGSAMKGTSVGSRPAHGGSTRAGTMHMQAAQMKEDLYGDLTGLIVRGVKSDNAEDIFDCLQTGRNGTLHFKLAIETNKAGDKYEEAQFTYRPQLDPGRDGELIELLPDYLVEEITFPRPHAAKFYSRVSRALTERVE